MPPFFVMVRDSANNNGQATVTVYFRQGTYPDMAAVNVQNRFAQAQGLLPAEVVGINNGRLYK